MNNKVFFEKKKTPQIIAAAVLLGLELLVFSKTVEYYENSNYIALGVQQLVIAAIFIPVFWKLQINATLQIYEDGISYINILTRKFLRWDEVAEVKAFRFPNGLLLELISGSKSVRIPTGTFKDKDNIVKFLDEKLGKFTYDVHP